MTQTERRIFLIQELLREQPRYGGLEIPADGEGQRRMLRSLMNLRPPWPAAREFLQVQDAYLQEETRRKGITSLANLRSVQEGIYLWKGDITTLACGAIVNASRSIMCAWQKTGGDGRDFQDAARAAAETMRDAIGAYVKMG